MQLILSITYLLLFVTSITSTPVPPNIGKIVKIAPTATEGGVSITQWGAKLPHPHIVVGQGKKDNVVLAPVSHTNHPKYNPRMPTTGMHSSLSGNVYLGHVTAHMSKLQSMSGALNNAGVSQNHVELIKQAKQAFHTDDHKSAAAAHKTAAQAHRDAHEEHLKAMAHHRSQHELHKSTDATKAQFHENRVAHHQQMASKHKGKALKGDKRVTHHEKQAAGPPSHHSNQAAWKSEERAKKATRDALKSRAKAKMSAV